MCTATCDAEVSFDVNGFSADDPNSFWDDFHRSDVGCWLLYGGIDSLTDRVWEIDCRLIDASSGTCPAEGASWLRAP